MSKIEQIIEDIEVYIDGCKYQALSNTKIIVNRNELGEYLDELKEAIPEEIKQYQRIIANRDAILKDAQDRAEDKMRDAQDKSDVIIQRANEMTSNLVSEHEIMQQAYKEANQIIEEASEKAGKIIDRATTEANEMKRAAMQYTDSSLASIQEILSSSIEDLTVKHDAIIRSLESSLDITTQNRMELRATPMPASTYAQKVEAKEQEELVEEPEKTEEYEEYEKYDDYEEYDEDQEYYEEPVYGQHNPTRMSLDDVLKNKYSQDDEDITDFNLDISDFK
ncbi:MAG: hypothetical protein MJ092_05425 [Lachnospiraceae bacterium]|nr:hypothetical protein [Lachnospiraceae bacterium]